MDCFLLEYTEILRRKDIATLLKLGNLRMIGTRVGRQAATMARETSTFVHKNGGVDGPDRVQKTL